MSSNKKESNNNALMMTLLKGRTFIVLIVFSFAGCGGTNEDPPKSFEESKIRSELVGQWGMTTKDGAQNSKIGYIFNEDGTATSVAFGPGADGTYVIEEDKVVLTYESGDKVTFIYEYEDGIFRMKLEDAEWWNLYKL